ncbi:IS1096 element passenger TnpR family protein [Natronospora cellulosivora (SeqCode)]
MSRDKKVLSKEESFCPSIVEDFDLFMEYISANDLILTLKKKNLKQKDLYAMNALMTNKEEGVTEKSNQFSYPFLNLLFHLSTKSQLCLVDSRNRQPKLMVSDSYNTYKKLNFYEKYIFLLETFWVDIDWESIGIHNHDNLSLATVDSVLEILCALKAGEEVKIHGGYYQVYFSERNAFLRNFYYFGFWDVIECESLSTQEYEAGKIIANKLGILLADVLYNKRKITNWNRPYQNSFERENNYNGILTDFIFDKVKESKILTDQQHAELKRNFKAKIKSKLNDKTKIKNKIEVDIFYHAFRPIFPSGVLTKTLSSLKEKFKEGIYIFKCSYNNRVWREIKIADNHTLLDLHNIIQKAYDFDDDHLYSFYMDGVYGSNIFYNSKMCNRGPYVEEIKIGELNLYVGKNFLYLFDFGDNWKINISVEKILDKKTDIFEPEIIGSKGESPDQYPFY